jgi:hypothetical protein
VLVENISKQQNPYHFTKLLLFIKNTVGYTIINDKLVDISRLKIRKLISHCENHYILNLLYFAHNWPPAPLSAPGSYRLATRSTQSRMGLHPCGYSLGPGGNNGMME